MSNPENHQEHKESIQERWDAFLLAHPEFWTEFVKRTFQLINRGIQHYSADAICHIVRFHSAVDGRDVEEYKINNNYTALAARRFQEEFPEHAAFFNTRIRKSA